MEAAAPVGGTRIVAVDPTREQAWDDADALHEERGAAAPRARRRGVDGVRTPRKFGEDEELWRVTALLHDFDYEIHPTLDKHPQDGAPILREEGYPEVVIEGVLSHAEHLAACRATRR